MHPDYLNNKSQNTMATSNKKSNMLNTQYMMPGGVKVTSMPGEGTGESKFNTQVGFYAGQRSVDHMNSASQQQYIDKLDENRKRHNSVVKGLDANSYVPNDSALSPMNIALKAKRNAREQSGDAGADDTHNNAIDVQENESTILPQLTNRNAGLQ